MKIDIETLDPVASAKALVPLILESAARIDNENGLPAQLVAALHAAGMYRLLLPRSCGGFEIDLDAFAQTIETFGNFFCFEARQRLRPRIDFDTGD